MARDGAPARRGEAGFALLIVLWTLVLVALLLTRVTSAGSGEARLAGNLRSAAALQQLADGAVHDAIFHVLDSTSAQRWVADGTTRTLDVQGSPVRVRMIDLGGRINPNTAPADLLSALMRVLGEDQRAADGIANAIIDWRSPGQRSRITGASKIEPYRAAGRDFAPPSAKFQNLGDLALVLGMTPQLLALMRPHLTLYTTSDPTRALADAVVGRALDALADGEDAASDQPGESVISIEAVAEGAGGAEARRHAVASLDNSSSDTPWRILAWDDAAP